MFAFLARTTIRVSEALKLRPQQLFMGRDLDGNKYYEMPPQKYFFGLRENEKIKRIVHPYGVEGLSPSRPHQLPKKITNEWDSWLRHRRKDPPTIEELEENICKFNEMQQRIKQLEQKDFKDQTTPGTLNAQTDNDSQTVDSWKSPEKG